jgi:squalene synthase HpnD
MTAVADEIGTRPAVGSSFYTAMRILPRPRREAMYAIYGFCRAVDDIADGTGPRDERLRQLEAWRADIDALFAGQAPTRAADLADPIAAFGLRRPDFHAVIDGMVMDVKGDIRAPDWATLDLYCDRVASAVGRLSTRIFGLPADGGDALAHHLGRALQLTNILRDIDDDAALGRLYLPREALQAAGISRDEPAAALAHPGLGQACLRVSEQAKAHFREADRIMAGCPRPLVRAPRLMAAAYSTLLDDLLARGWSPPRAPVRVRRLRLLGAVLRYGVM